MKNPRTLLALLFLAVVPLLLAGCGGDGSSPPIFSVATSALPGATVGTAYNQTLTAIGGAPPYTWSISAGSLPAGLSLNGSTGAITGTPTTTGTASFTVKATDSSTTPQTATRALSITVTTAAALTVTTASLPGASIGTPYSQTLAASGGRAPYTWSISAGALPAGLNLNGPTGVISGTATTAGTANFTAMATDSATPAATATKALSIVVSSGGAGPPAAPSITSATGGTNSVTLTWSAASGATSYNLYWSATSGVTTTNGTRITLGNVTTYKHSRLTATPTWLAANTPYFYILTAVNGAGESTPSSQATATTSATDGVALYAANCAGCHNPLATSSKHNRTATQIQNAINNNTGGMGSLSGLTTTQVQAIADVLVTGF